MRTIAIAELKAHLSAEVKRAHSGEVLVIIDHRRPVAMMGPLAAELRYHSKATRPFVYRDLAPLVSGDPLTALREERVESW
ncbi:MAG: hypothetical protein WCL50_10150 [Spirochaetota bacterium]